MKSISYTKKFKKHLRHRFNHQPKILKQVRINVAFFQKGIRDQPLNDHPLGQKMKGLRAFSITEDVRIVYRETAIKYEFLDIGTHGQVYK